MRAIKLLLILSLPLPAAAQDAFPPGAPPMPVCNALRDGATACLSGKLCQCGFERGGSLTGRPDAWRWECGALRPNCGALLPPADLGGPGMLPAPQVILPWPYRGR